MKANVRDTFGICQCPTEMPSIVNEQCVTQSALQTELDKVKDGIETKNVDDLKKVAGLAS